MQKSMRACVINKFGDSSQFKIIEVPIPTIDENEILIKLDYAGIGQWDTFEREGGYDQMLELNSTFPYILGSEGSGKIVSLGKSVEGFELNDEVYATGFLNPKGGFYAEYVAVNSKYVKKTPDTLSLLQASVIGGVGLTALRGLIDILDLSRGESIAIFGASGGVGHIAVQIAKSLGAKIYAIASESDGVSIIKNYGIEHVVNGKSDDVIAEARSAGYTNFDKVLLTCSHNDMNQFITEFCIGGKIAYPFGIFPEPEINDEATIAGYNGEPDEDILNRLNKFILDEEVKPHIDQVFNLTEVRNGHKRLAEHYVGKLAFKANLQ